MKDEIQDDGQCGSGDKNAQDEGEDPDLPGKAGLGCGLFVLHGFISFSGYFSGTPVAGILSFLSPLEPSANSERSVVARTTV